MLCPLKTKVRSENIVYHQITPFPLALRGRDGVRIQPEPTRNISRSTIYQYLRKEGVNVNGFTKSKI